MPPSSGAERLPRVTGVLDVGVVVVIVAILLIFVRAVFRLVDRLGPRDQ
jgi:hypothetical protein